MSLLGDVGGWVLSVLYSYRVPVAIVAIAIVVILAAVARRRRWLARVQRHPRALALVGAPAVIVGLAVALYLLSPLLVRTTLNEPPVTGAAASPAATSSTVVPPTGDRATPSVKSTERPADSVAPPTLEPTPTPPPWVAAPARTGTFQGTDDFHFGRGTATLTETAPGEWTLRLADFSVRNGPDLYVYLSPNPTDYAEGALELERLRATDGSFNVSVPAGADVAGQRSVLIWCKQFSHLFAYATLEP
jgi:hypothetical protein